jgi:hypothetical protein
LVFSPRDEAKKHSMSEAEEEHPHPGVTDAETAAAAAAEDAAQSMNFVEEQGGATISAPGGVNKWSKNGYGATVTKQSGKFSREESELIRASIAEYCAAKQITVARLCSECDHKAELKGAWMEIAKRLPHRSVQSVYRHGIRQCHPFKRGAWTEAECQQLVELVAGMGKKWSAIQTKLNRSADSCRDKYREMSDEYVKGRWKEEETEQLKRLIREQLQAEPGTDMKDLGKMVQERGIQIPWSTISKRMGKRSRLSVFKKWQKMTGICTGAADEEELYGTVVTSNKRQRLEGAPTAGANPTSSSSSSAFDAQRAAETVEAVELPDVHIGAAAAAAATGRGAVV